VASPKLPNRKTQIPLYVAVQIQMVILVKFEIAKEVEILDLVDFGGVALQVQWNVSMVCHGAYSVASAYMSCCEHGVTTANLKSIKNPRKRHRITHHLNLFFFKFQNSRVEEFVTVLSYGRSA